MGFNRFMQQLERKAQATSGTPAPTEAPSAPADDEHGRARQDATEERIQRLEEELKSARRSHHQQGSIDAQLMADAQAWRAHQANAGQASEGNGPKMSDDARKLLDEVEPQYREVIAALARESVLEQNDEVREALDFYRKTKTENEGQRLARLRREGAELNRLVPDAQARVQADPDLDRRLMALADTGMSLVDAFASLTGEKVGTSASEPAANPTSGEGDGEQAEPPVASPRQHHRDTVEEAPSKHSTWGGAYEAAVARESAE